MAIRCPKVAFAQYQHTLDSKTSDLPRYGAKFGQIFNTRLCSNHHYLVDTLLSSIDTSDQLINRYLVWQSLMIIDLYMIFLPLFEQVTPIDWVWLLRGWAKGWCLELCHEPCHKSWSLFSDLSTFIISIADRKEPLQVQQNLLMRISNYLHVLYAIKASLHDGSGDDGELLET